jgi:hypothetical protein
VATLLAGFAWMGIFPLFLPFASMGFASMGEHHMPMRFLATKYVILNFPVENVLATTITVMILHVIRLKLIK